MLQITIILFVTSNQQITNSVFPNFSTAQTEKNSWEIVHLLFYFFILFYLTFLFFIFHLFTFFIFFYFLSYFTIIFNFFIFLFVHEFNEKWDRLFLISRSFYVKVENWTIREEFENNNKFNFSKISTKLRENSVS